MKKMSFFLFSIFLRDVTFCKMRRFSADESSFSIDLFENPLAQVDPITVKSSADVERELETIQKLSDERSEWDQKWNAIKRCMSLIKGGILEYPNCDLSRIIPNIAQTVTDLRSTLVKWGAMFACAISNALGAKFSPYVDIYIPNLFKQATHGTAIISKSCHYAIVKIVTNSPCRKTARAILDKVNDKSQARRLIVAESLNIMSVMWPKNVFTPFQSDISNAINKLKKDASVDVRNAFRTSGVSSPGISPPPSLPSPITNQKAPMVRIYGTPRGSVKEKRGSTLIPSSIPRPSTTSKMVRQPNSPSINTSLSKPQTEEEANSFIAQINSHIDSVVPASKRRLAKLLPEAFPAAVDLASDNTLLLDIIPKLLKKYKEEMKSCITDVLISMELEGKVTKSALVAYGFDELLSLFSNDADAIIFVVRVHEQFPEYLTESCLPQLKILRKNNYNKDPQNIPVIDKIISELSPSASDIIHKVLHSVKNGTFTDADLQLPKELNDSDIEEELNNSTKLPNMLMSGDDVTYFSLCFIQTALKEWPNLTLLSSFSSLISILSDEKSLFKPMAEKILVKILMNNNINKRLVPFIKTQSELTLPAINTLAIFLSKAPEEKVKELTSSLPEILVPLLGNESVSIRRCTVMCFAYLSQVCHKEIEETLSKLSKKDSLLIDHFAKKWKRE